MAILRTRRQIGLLAAVAVVAVALVSASQHDERETEHRGPSDTFDDQITDHASNLMKRGRQIFRFDTFGDERFWGGALRNPRCSCLMAWTPASLVPSGAIVKTMYSPSVMSAGYLRRRTCAF